MHRHQNQGARLAETRACRFDAAAECCAPMPGVLCRGVASILQTSRCPRSASAGAGVDCCAMPRYRRSPQQWEAKANVFSITFISAHGRRRAVGYVTKSNVNYWRLSPKLAKHERRDGEPNATSPARQPISTSWCRQRACPPCTIPVPLVYCVLVSVGIDGTRHLVSAPVSGNSPAIRLNCRTGVRLLKYCGPRASQ